MDGIVVVGLLEVVAISMVPVAIFWVCLHGFDIYARCVALGRRVHLLPTPVAPPAGPPLEKLAEDLRRLHPEARTPQPGVRMARHRGIVAAYDLTLVATARALEVHTTLHELPTTSIDREAERMRLEHALTRAGLSWQVQDH